VNKHATYQQLRGHLAYLKLAAAAEQLPKALEDAEKTKPGYTEFLTDLLAVEVTATEERRLAGRLRLAGFPSKKTLEEFDFTAQPTIDERLVRELATLRFIEEKANALLIGAPGSGRRCPRSRSATRPCTPATASTTQRPQISSPALPGRPLRAAGRPRCASGTDRSY
jgi:DNA replication protein DnaC